MFMSSHYNTELLKSNKEMLRINTGKSLFFLEVIWDYEWAIVEVRGKLA